MVFRGRYFGWIAVGLFFSCQVLDKKTPEATMPLNQIYLHCQVTGDDEREFVTVLIQLFKGRTQGKAIKMPEPGFVELNGNVLIADSTPVTGYFYEMMVPVEEFRGEHKITIADDAKQQASETFSYSPFQLVTQLGPSISKQDLVFELRGVEEEEPVQVVLIDTVYSTSDINRIDTVENNQLFISQNDLYNIETGPVTLLIYKEETKKADSPNLLGGRLRLSFGIKREFDLTD